MTRRQSFMQTQTTRTFGRNPLATAALGIGLLAASLLGAATLSDAIELPSLGASTHIERRVEAPAPVQSYNFREANLYHPGFDGQRVATGPLVAAQMRLDTLMPNVVSQSVARPSLEAAEMRLNAVMSEVSSQAATRPALETAFLEMNLVIPAYQQPTEILATETMAFVEANTILHPDSTESGEIQPNQPS